MERDEETKRLLAALRTTDDLDQVAELRERLVSVHMGLARRLALQYCNRGMSAEDLEQVAYLELVVAAKAYDPAKGDSFAAYAVPCIRGAIKRHFRDRGWVVRPPRRTQNLQYAVWRASDELVQTLGRDPQPEEVAAQLGAPLTEVEEAMLAGSCFHPTSLDLPVRAGEEHTGQHLVDLLPAAGDGLHAAEARVMLGPAIRHLDTRDRHVLELRYVEQLSQQEIADDIGVTQMQVSRILRRIHDDLRHRLGELDGARRPGCHDGRHEEASSGSVPAPRSPSHRGRRPRGHRAFGV